MSETNGNGTESEESAFINGILAAFSAGDPTLMERRLENVPGNPTVGEFGSHILARLAAELTYDGLGASDEAPDPKLYQRYQEGIAAACAHGLCPMCSLIYPTMPLRT